MKSDKLIRLISALLFAVMLISAFASCAETTPNEETTAGASIAETQAAVLTEEVTTADPTLDAHGYLKDALPEDLKFNDEITLLVWDDVEHEEFEIEYDKLSGDIVEQSLYDRNSKVEQRLGLKLNFIRVKGNTDNVKNWNAYVGNSVSINAKEFDIIASYSVSVAKNASSGYLYNMLEDDCEYLDFEKPWWSELLLEQATFGDNLYFASGDISRNALEMMYVCFVNTTLLEKYNLENPQDLVEKNEWTYAKFIEMCQGIYEDTDGDGTKSHAKDSGDTFGYMTSGTYADGWFYGSGASICEKNADGDIVASETFKGERVANTVDMLCELFYSSNFGVYATNGGGPAHQNAFGQGRLLFMTDRARVSHYRLAPLDFDDFLIVPCPKYDSDQERYYTTMGNPFTLYAIPSDIEDPKMASAFIECFASEGYRIVTPAVFELSLKTRYVDDPVSAMMYDIVRANIVYDIGRLFSTDLIGQSTFRNALANNQSWGAVAVQATKGLDKAVKKLNSSLNK